MYKIQRLNITDNVQTLCDSSGFPNYCNVGLGPSLGVNSHYKSDWFGPTLGLEFAWHYSSQLSFVPKVSVMYGNYTSSMDWNLREDLHHPASQTQRAKSLAISSGLGMKLALNNSNIVVKANINHQKLSTPFGGEHYFHTTNGTVLQRLNNAWQQSWRVDFAIEGYF
jgi:hypothetical protein